MVGTDDINIAQKAKKRIERLIVTSADLDPKLVENGMLAVDSTKRPTKFSFKCNHKRVGEEGAAKVSYDQYFFTQEGIQKEEVSYEEGKFDLDPDLLAEYPEMKSISGLPQEEAPKDTWIVSAIFVNGMTIDSFIDDVIDGSPTGSVEYHLDLVDSALRELAALSNPEYNRFIELEAMKLEDRKKRAKAAIGDKKRNMGNMERLKYFVSKG